MARQSRIGANENLRDFRNSRPPETRRPADPPVVQISPRSHRQRQRSSRPAVCICCGQARGYVYDGAPYAEADELEDAICPWCIADGSAHREVRRRVHRPCLDRRRRAARRGRRGRLPHPWLHAWQQERWLTCCHDACAFLEPAGHAEIEARYPRLEGTLITTIVQEMRIPGGAAHQLYRSLNRDHGPTAYVFQCLHCDNQPAYIDTP